MHSHIGKYSDKKSVLGQHTFNVSAHLKTIEEIMSTMPHDR